MDQHRGRSLGDAQQAAELAAGIERVLADVRAAVDDWKPMVARLEEAIAELGAAPGALAAPVVSESRDFLEWLAANHFTLLGYRQHRLVSEDGEDMLRLVTGSGLGVLRETEAERTSTSFSELPPEARALARAPTPVVIVTKANRRSTVHRPGYTDYIGVKRYDASGRVIGEHRFLGLFTSTAYSASVSETPLLRGKVGRSLRAPACRRVVTWRSRSLTSSRRIRATSCSRSPTTSSTSRRSASSPSASASGCASSSGSTRSTRFVSCLVYVPRDAYSTDLRVPLPAHPDGGVRQQQRRVQRPSSATPCWPASIS